MNGKFPDGAKCAQYDVEGHPRESQPACPVAAPKHECSRQDCHSLGEFDPYAVWLSQIVNMVESADDSHGEKKAGDDKDWNRTADRVHGSTSAAI